VGVAVVAPNCRAWRAAPILDLLTPGPHQGSATVLLRVPQSRGLDRDIVYAIVAAESIVVRQGGGPPAAPDLTVQITGDLATLAWEPPPGGAVFSWIVRGAFAGAPLADVVTLDRSLRSWTSPPLPSGSYEVELVAANDAGRGSASPRVRFSTGLTVPPAPPRPVDRRRHR
jgi:hypothetical protein